MILSHLQGAAVSAATLTPEGHETKPPARYTEATLIKELEDRVDDLGAANGTQCIGGAHAHPPVGVLQRGDQVLHRRGSCDRVQHLDRGAAHVGLGADLAMGLRVLLALRRRPRSVDGCGGAVHRESIEPAPGRYVKQKA